METLHYIINLIFNQIARVSVYTKYKQSINDSKSNIYIVKYSVCIPSAGNICVQCLQIEIALAFDASHTPSL